MEQSEGDSPARLGVANAMQKGGVRRRKSAARREQRCSEKSVAARRTILREERCREKRDISEAPGESRIKKHGEGKRAARFDGVRPGSVRCVAVQRSSSRCGGVHSGAVFRSASKRFASRPSATCRGDRESRLTVYVR